MLTNRKFYLSVLWTVLLFSPCISQSNYLYVSSLVKDGLEEAFKVAWKLDDIATLHYAVKSYTVLNKKIPVSDEDICEVLKKVVAETNSVEVLYHVTAITKDIIPCASSQLLSDVGKKVLIAKDRGNLGIEDLYYIVSSLKAINDNFSDVSFVAKSLKAALKSNQTLSNFGYAFHIGTVLEKRDSQPLFDEIGSVVAQVDVIDNKYYQFEGGLTLTAFIVEGIYRLAESLDKVPPLKNDQLLKFFDYFLSRLSVSRPRGIFSLVQVLSILSNNKFHSYVTVGMINDRPIFKASPVIQVRISDVFGAPLLKDSTLSVTFESGQKSNGEVISVKKTLKGSADKLTYTISAIELNLTPDQYTFKVSVADSKNGKKVIINSDNHVVEFKVSYLAKIENFQIGVLDSEQSSTSNLNKLEYPNKLKEELSIDSQQRLLLKFSLKDLDFGGTYKVQQVFVKLVDKTSDRGATFISLSDSNQNYKLTIDLSMAKSSLEFVSGEYNLVLIIGDALLAESLKWEVANVKFKHTGDLKLVEDHIECYYKPKPEIKHLFKEPERRPPAIVSTVFTVLVLTPLLLLFILWLKLHVNIRNFSFSLSAVGFHAGIGSIFLLFGTFWLQLNMFQTLKYLLVLGFVTFLCGNKMLCSIAEKRKK